MEAVTNNVKQIRKVLMQDADPGTENVVLGGCCNDVSVAYYLLHGIWLDYNFYFNKKYFINPQKNTKEFPVKNVWFLSEESYWKESIFSA